MEEVVYLNKYFKHYSYKDTVNVVSEVICDCFGIAKYDLNSKSRKRKFVYARIISTKILKDNTDLNSAEIAGAVNRDHATALYHLKIFDSCLYDPYFISMYSLVNNAINKKIVPTSVVSKARVSIKSFVEKEGKAYFTRDDVENLLYKYRTEIFNELNKKV